MTSCLKKKCKQLKTKIFSDLSFKAITKPNALNATPTTSVTGNFDYENLDDKILYNAYQDFGQA